jgi:hypothetical protein
MGTTTTRSIKLLVPEGATREDLMVFARRTIKRQLRIDRFKILSISPAHSKSEKDGEMTYRVAFTNLMPN